MMLYYTLFYAQGLFDHVHHEQILKQRGQIMNSIAAPFLFVGVVFLAILCMPSNYTGTGSIFNYPLYSDHQIQSLYTTGTWLWIYGLIWLGEVTINDTFHEPTYDFIMNCSMYGYLSHYLWIALISAFVVAPTGMSYPAAVITEFVGTISLIAITHVAIEKVSGLCCPPKPKDANAHAGNEGDEPVPSEEFSSTKRTIGSGKTPPLLGTIDSADAPADEEGESLLAGQMPDDQPRRSF